MKGRALLALAGINAVGALAILHGWSRISASCAAVACVSAYVNNRRRERTERTK